MSANRPDHTGKTIGFNFYSYAQLWAKIG